MQSSPEPAMSAKSKGTFRSLYVHFPFCESKCHYCDFYSLGRERTKEADAPTFEIALYSEAERFKDLLAPELDTLFFGGGTPSMTPPDSMARALAPLTLESRMTPLTEWTMEANPSSVDLENLKAYKKIGVNRISMGVQALRPDLLQALGRVHSKETALSSLAKLFEAGFDNVSVDLLCGVPGQGLRDIEEALETLTGFPISHLSCYLLTLPKHHKMFPLLPIDDEQLSHLLFVDHWMTSHGFEHYEISNYAKPGKKARHNLNYWKGASYLGLGPSAHSFDGPEKKRWKNVSSLHKYASLLRDDKTPVEWAELLKPEQLQLESWMLALRLNDGFPELWLESEAQKMKASLFEREGLLERHPILSQRMRLTPKGFALSDQVISALA